MTKRVLVCDDERHIRRLLEVNLTRQGHSVTAAEDGQEALDHLATQEFDVVIIDMVMPHVDGLEVLKRIRTEERTHRMYVVLLTTQAFDMEADHEFKPDLYIRKPADFNDFKI